MYNGLPRLDTLWSRRKRKRTLASATTGRSEMASLAIQLLACLLLLCLDAVFALTQTAADEIERSLQSNAIDTQSRVATTVLTQPDFERGTVIVSEPGVYVLGEDVEFNPNPLNDWLPDCNETSPGYQEHYCIPGKGPRAAYRLGFFAAIAIEADGVVLNLNNKELRQSKTHALQQRFFSLIELASAPFIGLQGPAPGGFASDGFSPARNTTVRNGRLGLSAHHGIHGNNASHVLLEDLVLANYEVAGIALNGGVNIVIQRCSLLGSRRDIPVRATYSAARLMLQASEPLVPFLGTGAASDIGEKMRALKNVLSQAKDEILRGGRLQSPELIRQFGLESVAEEELRVVDGNAYGISLSSTGVIVDEWRSPLDDQSSPDLGHLRNIVIRDVVIYNTTANVQEVPTISTFNSSSGEPEGQQVDSAGASIRMMDILDDSGERYVPDALHDMRFACAYWSSAAHGNDSTLVSASSEKRFGTFSISGAMAEWARGGAANLSAVMAASKVEWVCNRDAMAHRQKGVVGLLIQAAEEVYLENITVSSTRNFGKPGNAEKCGQYLAADKAQADSPRARGYTGSTARGILLVASRSVRAVRILVDGVMASTGSVYGLQCFNDVRKINFESILVRSIRTLQTEGAPLPNGASEAHGIAFDGAVSGIQMVGVNVSENSEQ